MTEHTDKATRKSGKAVPRKRPGKGRTPGGKQARERAGEARAPAADDAPAVPGGSAAPAPRATEPHSLAPDPASVTFGSNRPIVAPPAKLPASSGLRFSGASAGVLKASGPQPTSAKASGLTFTNAKPGTDAQPAAATTSERSAADGGGKRPPETALPASGAAKPAKKETAGAAKLPATAAKPGTAAKAPPLTKPAIAPQASGRRLEKERSSRHLVPALVVVAMMVGGVAFWLDRAGKPSVPAQELASAPPARETADDLDADDLAADDLAANDLAAADPAPRFGPSVRAPESPGPLAALPEEAAAPASPGGRSGAAAPSPTAPGDAPHLTTAEVGEIQYLLRRLELDPGSLDGLLTAETARAIRSYQEMAGLPADGKADRELLEELRTVVTLYGG